MEAPSDTINTFLDCQEIIGAAGPTCGALSPLLGNAQRYISSFPGVEHPWLSMGNRLGIKGDTVTPPCLQKHLCVCRSRPNETLTPPKIVLLLLQHGSLPPHRDSTAGFPTCKPNQILSFFPNSPNKFKFYVRCITGPALDDH